MAKHKHDNDTRDWIDEDEDRRAREERDHARRQLRKEKLNERKNSEAPTEDRHGIRPKS
jgi:hypothetical protein